MKWDEFPIQPVHLTTFISWIIEKRPPCYSSHAFVYPGFSCLSFRVLALPLLSPVCFKTHFPSDWTIDGTVMMLGFSLVASERHKLDCTDCWIWTFVHACDNLGVFFQKNTANLSQTTTATKMNKKREEKKNHIMPLYQKCWRKQLAGLNSPLQRSTRWVNGTELRF